MVFGFGGAGGLVRLAEARLHAAVGQRVGVNEGVGSAPELLGRRPPWAAAVVACGTSGHLVTAVAGEQAGAGRGRPVGRPYAIEAHHSETGGRDKAPTRRPMAAHGIAVVFRSIVAHDSRSLVAARRRRRLSGVARPHPTRGYRSPSGGRLVQAVAEGGLPAAGQVWWSERGGLRAARKRSGGRGSTPARSSGWELRDRAGAIDSCGSSVTAQHRPMHEDP